MNTLHPSDADSHLQTSQAPADRLVVIAASAGGLNALQQIVSPLPADFAAAIAIVLHVSADNRSFLSQILNRSSALKITQVEDKEAIVAGHVYTAAPDHHLIVNRDRTFSLTQTAAVRFLRPRADLLFESAAQAYQDRAIAIVLSGTGEDGASGLKKIKEIGGTVIVQTPEMAQFSEMPAAAIETGLANLVLPLDEIVPALMDLIQE
jgi:two-component system chemotaxis response regulator CheB